MTCLMLFKNDIAIWVEYKIWKWEKDCFIDSLFYIVWYKCFGSNLGFQACELSIQMSDISLEIELTESNFMTTLFCINLAYIFMLNWNCHSEANAYRFEQIWFLKKCRRCQCGVLIFENSRAFWILSFTWYARGERVIGNSTADSQLRDEVSKQIVIFFEFWNCEIANDGTKKCKSNTESIYLWNLG